MDLKVVQLMDSLIELALENCMRLRLQNIHSRGHFFFFYCFFEKSMTRSKIKKRSENVTKSNL